MRGVFGDIWQIALDDPNGFVVVPTNCVVKANGEAVMGAGMAKQAAQRHPELPRLLGKALQGERQGPQCHVFEEIGIVCLPTKLDWRDKASLDLINSGCRDLLELRVHFPEITFYMPLLGCGLGGLDWKKQVRPVLVERLADREFVVVKEKR